MVIQIFIKELVWEPKLVSEWERERKWFEQITRGNPVQMLALASSR